MECIWWGSLLVALWDKRQGVRRLGRVGIAHAGGALYHCRPHTTQSCGHAYHMECRALNILLNCVQLQWWSVPLQSYTLPVGCLPQHRSYATPCNTKFHTSCDISLFIDSFISEPLYQFHTRNVLTPLSDSDYEGSSISETSVL